MTCHKMTPGNPTDITVTYFRSFAVILTRDTAAMFPSFQNPVALTEHECRDPHLPVVFTDRESRGRRKKRGFGVAKIIQCVQ